MGASQNTIFKSVREKQRITEETNCIEISVNVVLRRSVLHRHPMTRSSGRSQGLSVEDVRGMDSV